LDENTSNSLPEMSSMKDALLQQQDIFSPGSAARQEDFAEDFSAGVCPQCGGYPSFDKDALDKDPRKVIAPECSTCNCERYASKVGKSSDRHGLV
jgi:hypothetical protein